MVRAVLASLVAFLAVTACRPGLTFPPRIVTGPVSDTTRLISALPDSGAVNICKNGSRAFDLDAIVADEDDADSVIEWSISAGPGLEVRLKGDTALVGPLPNSVCTSYVAFTATDPGGLSTSRTCPISVFEFQITVDTITVDSGTFLDAVLDYDYRPDLKSGLVWGAPAFDTTWLPECTLRDSSGAMVLHVSAGDSIGITGVFLTVSDPVNNVDFHHGILVRVERTAAASGVRLSALDLSEKEER